MNSWQEKICGAFILCAVAAFLIPAVCAADVIPPGQDNNNPTMPASNPNSWQVPSVMPTLPATANTNSSGSVTINFTSGSLFRNQLSDLWAQVIYDRGVEYWDLDPGMLAFDGKSIKMQFGPAFDGKTLTVAFYGFYGTAFRTGFTNTIQIAVQSGPANISIPNLPSSGATDATGKIILNFTAGSLFTNQLNDLWARVSFDGKSEHWDLDPGMLAFDGKSINMQFAPQFNAKVVRMEFYAFDKQGRQAAFGNPVDISVTSGASNVTMPTLPASGATSSNGKIAINFTSGSLLANQLNELWARVDYEGKTERWKLDPGLLSNDGKTFNLQFESKFNAKDLQLELFGFDKQGRQTPFSNPINININSGPASIILPTPPTTATTTTNGKVSINFVSGTLSANQLSELWARINYEGKSEHWKLDPGMLSADGKSLNLQFESKFNGKVIKTELYGLDQQGKQTGFFSPIEITINSIPPTLTMPSLPANISTDTSNKATINFTSGSLSGQDLSGLRAHVSYDDKKEDWKLEPTMLANDGKSIALTLEPKFDNKVLNVDLYGFDNSGKQLSPTNTVEITVSSGPNPIVIPTLAAGGATDINGNIKINFASGTLNPNDIKELWARVSYDGNTEHWKLHPSFLAGDGKFFSMQFEPKFEGKVMKLELYAFDKQGKQTGLSNQIEITVTSLPSSLTMPTLPSAIKTGPNGDFTVNFLSGALLPTQLNDLWANVNYDGKTEQWNLDPGMLSADGKALKIQIEPKLDGKTLKFELYGFDTQGKQISLSNPMQIIVNSSLSIVAMPALPSTATTDANGKLSINFTSGSLSDSTLSDLWARVSYDGKIEDWDLDPAILADDNKSLDMRFEPKFDGKLLRIEFYAFDKQGKKTALTNPIDITVNSSLSPIAMPTLTLNAATDNNGKVAINFTSGSLSANQLSELWAKVNYDNKSEFWKLQPGLLAEDSNSLNMKFAPQLKGKVLRLWFYGFDKNGKQTIFTNPIEITVTP